MGVDARLYINNRFSAEDIATVLSRIVGKKLAIIIENTINPEFGRIEGEGNDFFCYYHGNVRTPIGYTKMLSRRTYSEEQDKAFKKLAEEIGGFYMFADCDGNIEEIQGKLDDEDGLQYFLKYAVVHDGIEHDDIEALKQAIKQWNTRVKGVSSHANF